MTATAQVTDTVEETFSFGSDAISDEDTTPSDNNNCYFNSDRKWKGVGGFLNRQRGMMRLNCKENVVLCI